MLDLLNLLQIFGEYFWSIGRSNPATSLFNDLLNDIVFNYLANIYLVMSLFENAVLTCVLDFHVVKKLKPEIFKLISVILEEIEIVTDCWENFIKFCLEFSTVIFSIQLHNFLRLSFACLLIGNYRHGSVFRRLSMYLIDKTIFLSIFIQLILHGAYDALNFCLE